MNQIDIYLQSIKKTNDSMKEDILNIICQNSSFDASLNYLYDRIIYGLKRYVYLDLDNIIFCDNFADPKDYKHYFNIDYEMFKKNLRLSGLEVNDITFVEQIKITNLIDTIESNDRLYQSLLEKYYNRFAINNLNMSLDRPTD